MTRQNQITLRFVAAAVLHSIACIGLWSDSPLATLAWAVAFIVATGSDELHRPIPKHEYWQLPVVLLVILGFMFLPRLALSSDTLDRVEGVARHPVTVSALWLLMMLGIYAEWRREWMSVDD